MKKIYHVLSSNIPHHNNTVLQFFEQRLRDKIPSEAMAKFLVVGKDLIRTYPNLNVEEFSSKKEIATALTKIATTDPNVYFYLHGQFNFISYRLSVSLGTFGELIYMKIVIA